MEPSNNNNWKGWALGALFTIVLSVSGYSFVSSNEAINDQAKLQAQHAERIAKLETSMQGLREDIGLMRQQLYDIHKLLLERRK